MILRVAAVVNASVPEVRAAIEEVRSTARVVETAAGVLVTLERPHRGPLPTRRNVLRRLERDMATIRNRCESDRDRSRHG